jgi:hypothetical protein
MWRVHRLDQINAFKQANPFDFESLALTIRKKQIGLFKTVIRSECWDRPQISEKGSAGIGPMRSRPTEN